MNLHLDGTRTRNLCQFPEYEYSAGKQRSKDVSTGRKLGIRTKLTLTIRPPGQFSLVFEPENRLFDPIQLTHFRNVSANHMLPFPMV
jgi:hypothetical protein